MFTKKYILLFLFVNCILDINASCDINWLSPVNNDDVSCIDKINIVVNLTSNVVNDTDMYDINMLYTGVTNGSIFFGNFDSNIIIFSSFFCNEIQKNGYYNFTILANGSNICSDTIEVNYIQLCDLNIYLPIENTISDCINNNTDNIFITNYDFTPINHLYNITYILTGDANVSQTFYNVNTITTSNNIKSLSCDLLPDFGSYNFTILADSGNEIFCNDTKQIYIRKNESCIINITSPIQDEIIVCDTDNWFNFTIQIQKNDTYNIEILYPGGDMSFAKILSPGEHQISIDNACSSVFNSDGDINIKVFVSKINDLRCLGDVSVIVINNTTTPTSAPTTIPTTIPTSAPKNGSLIISLVFLIITIIVFILLMIIVLFLLKICKKK